MRYVPIYPYNFRRLGLCSQQETHELFVALIVHMCEHISMKNAIENFRLASGLSFQEIADRCRGSRLISAESAVKYSHGLGIPLSELRPDLWPPPTSHTDGSDSNEDDHA